ncbi:MAG: TRAP transporter small permease subunit [Pseudomonadota bacterium]
MAQPADQRRDDEDLGAAIAEASRATDLADPDAGASPFDRTLNRLVEAAGVAIFVTIVGIVFVNATGRYAFSTTLIWGDELVLSLLPWLGMTGMFLAIRRRAAIRIGAFVDRMPRGARRVMGLAGSIVAAAIFTWLAIVSTYYMGFFGGDRTIYLQIQKGWFMSALVIGPGLAAVAYLVTAWRDWKAGDTP